MRTAQTTISCLVRAPSLSWMRLIALRTVAVLVPRVSAIWAWRWGHVVLLVLVGCWSLRGVSQVTVVPVPGPVSMMSRPPSQQCASPLNRQCANPLNATSGTLKIKYSLSVAHHSCGPAGQLGHSDHPHKPARPPPPRRAAYPTTTGSAPTARR